MTGQIPPYGEFFRRERREWSQEFASRAYVLKSDKRWEIRSDHSSEHWYTIFSGRTYTGPHPTFTEAMRQIVPQSTWRKFSRPMEFAWAATREHQGWTWLDARNYLRSLVAHPNQAITKCIAAGIIVRGEAPNQNRLTAVTIQVRERKVRPE
jgi:hypothetical protein